MYPSIDFQPHIFTGSQNEPYLIEQTLILQISNLSGEAMVWKNDTGKTAFDFKPLSEAEPVEGLTMLYLSFPLGEKPGDFTTEDFFSQIEFSLPDCLLYEKAEKDTLVIYPTATITLELMDSLEILLKKVITTGAAGEMVLVSLTLFDGGQKVFLGRRALYRTAPRLAITSFHFAEEDLPSAFRDTLSFSCCTLGAKKCIFTPGDTVLPTQTACPIDTTLYSPTVYALHAFAKERMVSRRLECIPKKASIVSFRGSFTTNPDNTREVTLRIEVENTRHIYLNRIGRIAVIPGETISLKLQKQPPDIPYILSVENEDGITRQKVTWE